MPAKMVKADGDAAGHAWRALHRAADKLGIEITKSGMKGGWTWRLPAKMPSTLEDDRHGTLAPSGKFGTFGDDSAPF